MNFPVPLSQVTVETVTDFDLEALREQAVLEHNVDLCVDCECALGWIGGLPMPVYTAEQRADARQRCVEAINRRRNKATP